jgi:16S rRNA C967 or C1407 C5-methylase (RsmB/RsmF family)/NOL1/NOP2/fmu family ribosome biogenesis protein
MIKLPEGFLQSIDGLPGFEAEAFRKAHEAPAPVSIRLHPRKGTGLFPEVPVIPWEPQGRYLPQRPVFALDPLWHAGAYYVQEASSMLAGWAFDQLFPQKAGLRVLDLCAAPGGKSTHLAALMPPDSLLLSNEVIRTRAGILTENVTRWGYANHWVSSNDPAAFARLPQFFDCLVVDAPCSGSGLFRKDPDAMAEWSPEAVQLCAQRQQRILHDAWPALKPGGVVIYATCSYSFEEDEAVVDAFCNETGAEPVVLRPDASWGLTAVQTAGGVQGFRCYPDKVRGEGFFGAVFRKPEAVVESPRNGKGKRPASAHDATLWKQASHLLSGSDWRCIPDGKNARALPAHLEADWQQLRQVLYLRRAGIDLGMPGAKDWIPDHALSAAVDLNPSVPSVALSLAEAHRYLRCEDPGLEPPQQGWLLAAYEGRPLGWMKAVKGRINNYLPRHLRLRMRD